MARGAAAEHVYESQVVGLPATQQAGSFCGRGRSVRLNSSALTSTDRRAEPTDQRHCHAGFRPTGAGRRADAADAAVAGWSAFRPLHGLPIATKTLTEPRECERLTGRPLFRDHVPAVKTRTSSASCGRCAAIGKTNVPEFAAGSTRSTQSLADAESL